MTHEVQQGKVEELHRRFPDDHFDLIHFDPPYYRVLANEWDRRWDSRDEFLAWLASVCDDASRILKPSGVFYIWTSWEMASAVEELVLRPRFDTISSIVWDKSARRPTQGMPTSRAATGGLQIAELRSWLNVSERLLCVGHKGLSIAEDPEGLKSQEARLWRELSEPLRSWLISQRDAAGLKSCQVDEALGTAGMAGHYFGASQWALPTREAYKILQRLADGRAFLQDYDELEAQRQDIRKAYDEQRMALALRRTHTAQRRQFSNVWRYAPVAILPGRHPAEKPVEMMQEIVATSSRPGDMVLDGFAGSGSMTAACVDLERNVIATEENGALCEQIRLRAERHMKQPPPARMNEIVGPLFGENNGNSADETKTAEANANTGEQGDKPGTGGDSGSSNARNTCRRFRGTCR